MKKLLSLALALLTVLALLAVPTVTVSAEEINYNATYTADDTWYDATKSEFHISTAAQLAYFMELGQVASNTFLNKTFYLDADIVWNDAAIVDGVWTPNTTDVHVWTPTFSAPANKNQFGGFRGTFDGQGHTITGLYLGSEAMSDTNVGFFAWTGNGCKIKNVNFEAVRVGAGQKSAALISTAYGDVTVENVYVNADIDASGNYVGTMIGDAGNVAKDLTYTFKNCSVAGDLTANAKWRVGGYIGHTGIYAVNFENCLCSMNVNGGKYTGGFVGSVCGFATASTAATFKGCYYTGKLDISANQSFKGAFATLERKAQAATAYTTVATVNLTDCYWSAGSAAYPIGIDTTVSYFKVVTDYTADLGANYGKTSVTYPQELTTTQAAAQATTDQGNIRAVTKQIGTALGNASTAAVDTMFIQLKENAGTVNARFVTPMFLADIDESKVTAFGFEMAHLTDKAVGKTPKTVVCDAAYQSLNSTIGMDAYTVESDLFKKGAVSPDYLMAATLKGVPATGVYFMTVKPFITVDGVTTVGRTRLAVFANGALVLTTSFGAAV